MVLMRNNSIRFKQERSVIEKVHLVIKSANKGKPGNNYMLKCVLTLINCKEILMHYKKEQFVNFGRCNNLLGTFEQTKEDCCWNDR